MLHLGIFVVRRDSMSDSCKMSGMGINQAHNGRIQNVQAQKSPKQRNFRLDCTETSLFFHCRTGTGDQPFQFCYTICSVLMTPARER